MGVANVMAIIQLIAAAQPIIEWIVTLIERLMKNQTGEAKKEVALKTVAKMLPEIPKEEASQMIDATVTVMNEVGAFSHAEGK